MRGKEITEPKKLILMGLCGGKCEFRGCEKSIVEDMLTGDKVNFSNYAHIIASSANGPRGDKVLSSKLSNDENNIMVLCRDHHKEVDYLPETDKDIVRLFIDYIQLMENMIIVKK